MGPTQDGVLFVVALESLTPIIVKSALSKKKIEMGAQKLLILAPQKLICSTKERSMASKSGNNNKINILNKNPTAVHLISAQYCERKS